MVSWWAWASGVAPAAADCERIGSGVFAQPANTLSGVAFLLAGAWIVVRSRRSPGKRVELAVFGLAVAANAVGGLLYHGIGTDAARWVHDEAILAVLAFVAVFAVARFRGWPTAGTVTTFVASLAGLGLLLALVPASSSAMYAVLGVGAGAWELGEYRHELPAMRAEGLTPRRAARLGVAAVALLAATAFFVGRTGAALCRPESVFQWHAVWHVLAAAAMALYAYAAIEPRARRLSPAA